MPVWVVHQQGKRGSGEAHERRLNIVVPHQHQLGKIWSLSHKHSGQRLRRTQTGSAHRDNFCKPVLHKVMETFSIRELAIRN